MPMFGGGNVLGDDGLHSRYFMPAGITVQLARSYTQKFARKLSDSLFWTFCLRLMLHIRRLETSFSARRFSIAHFLLSVVSSGGFNRLSKPEADTPETIVSTTGV
eukprot:scpid82860/ scgid12693/ 